MAKIAQPIGTKAKLLFRYFCRACTGRAFYSEQPNAFITRTCEHCGSTVEYDAGNYFKLDENSEEYRKVNQKNAW